MGNMIVVLVCLVLLLESVYLAQLQSQEAQVLCPHGQTQWQYGVQCIPVKTLLISFGSIIIMKLVLLSKYTHSLDKAHYDLSN